MAKKPTAAEVSQQNALPGKKKLGRPKGIPASDAQKAAAKENQKKAAAAIKKRAEARKLARLAGEKPRWKQLVDGDIDMSDLTMDELLAGAVANNDGSWDGRRHSLPARLKGRMETERRRRIRRDFDKLAPMALEAFEDLLMDADAPAQRLAAAKMVMEHQIGKVPEIVHVGQETAFDRIQAGAFVTILRGSENVDPGPDEGESDDDVHDVEWTEEDE